MLRKGKRKLHSRLSLLLRDRRGSAYVDTMILFAASFALILCFLAVTPLLIAKQQVDQMAEQLTRVIELTGETSKLDAFTKFLEPYGIIELARTGLVALARGKTNINDLLDYNDTV